MRTAKERMLDSSEKVCRILVAEDEPAVVRLITRLLPPEVPCEIISTATAPAAVEMIEDDQWDLIITDHGLAEGTGASVVEAAGSKEPPIPVIGIPGNRYSQLDYLPSERIVQKPFDMPDLVAVVKHVLNIA